MIFKEWWEKNGPPKHLPNDVLDTAETWAERVWEYQQVIIEDLSNALMESNEHNQTLFNRIEQLDPYPEYKESIYKRYIEKDRGNE